MKDNLEEWILCPPVINVIKRAFDQWDLESLHILFTMSQSSGRDYGTKEILTEQFLVLKERFLSKCWPDDYKTTDKWLHVCQRSSFYMGCEEILHFALCCFSKSPCESIVESVGSVINRHGCDSRSKLTMENVNEEVFVAWNGPEEFSCDARALIRKAMNTYFHNKLHLYTAGSASNSYSYTSSSIVNILNKNSRITAAEERVD